MADTAKEVLQRIELAEKLAPLSSTAPSDAFLSFFADHRGPLADLLTAQKSTSTKVRPFELRAAMMPPEQAVIEEEIKDLCAIPYRTRNGLIPECPGITRGFKGCPPYAPDVWETKELLGRAESFLIIQFAGEEGSAPQGEVHSFIAKVSETLGEEGYTVLETYASGPCRVCPKGCSADEECRLPDHRLFALEACGFWVPSICRAASKYPVLNDGPREIRWINNWHLPTQDTPLVTYTTGILLKALTPSA